MTRQEQISFFDEFAQNLKTILSSKGDDYANTDRLSNFRFAGNICGITPELNCLSLIATKVARLGNLLNGKEPKNEAITDSVIDLANYAILLAMIISETDKPS